MLRAWREQYEANQQLKRDIARERWEQEKRFQQEDRQASQAVLEANTVGLDEHNAAMKLAAGVSYLTLVCHEDTWTFVARCAFGHWKATWIKCTHDPSDFRGPNTASIYTKAFTVNPNLREGRIQKQQDGMQSVILSGHNLTRILDTLRTGSAGPDLVDSARCRTLYSKFAQFVSMVDPEAPSGQSTGIEFRIDDSVLPAVSA
ncbi:hypothetical protein F7Q99_36535 [Streptomyces kaniharaensis]|uniref:Uncharacterized protein n=1 Tax=Streptomyces kaniharaensis TaxID=212423 RepID=A0A6N7L1M4_9ACTN|nr:hypothetical protein [Streptomyces kaniharaensis]MQS17551.1 hypothetical protein [Streptomyces kaniharaensis]